MMTSNLTSHLSAERKILFIGNPVGARRDIADEHAAASAKAKEFAS
jgi:hypothetical protein